MNNMTAQENMTWDGIYYGAMKAGATEKAANDHAVMGLSDFRHGNYNPRNLKKKNYTPSDLVEQRIFLAKRQEWSCA